MAWSNSAEMRRPASFAAAGLAALALALLGAAQPAWSAAASGGLGAELGAERASADVRRTADWIIRSADNERLSFAILDKRQARLFVFEADGRLRGASAVLLGLAVGDDTVPGIGERELSSIEPHERTTPAGRFVAEPGHNLQGEDIVWIDYDAAVSLHRVRPGNGRDRRLERLASRTVADNRISFGCVNVPAAFYNAELKPTLGTMKSVVYVLPETRPLEAVFPGIAGETRTQVDRRSAAPL